MSNYVFVLNPDKTPLTPIHPALARKLLKNKEASVFRRYPFTIIIFQESSVDSNSSVEIKLDPGSKETGLALVLNKCVIWAGVLVHRGEQIKVALLSRSVVRRSRRNRKTRYRQPRFLNRKCSESRLAPSLMHRVLTIETWINRLHRYVPISKIAMELVKFDTQKMQDDQIKGAEYQQGTLVGYEVREYLLEKWNRQCAYCQAKNVPLQIEHIQAKSKGGSNRISNLTLACEKCNQNKGNQNIEEFLKGNQQLLTQIKVQSRKPLKDAAAVNSTRKKLYSHLKQISELFNWEMQTGTGGQTKYNRTRFDLPKEHWIDAACVGEIDSLTLKTKQPIMITATGWGKRQMVRVDKYGFPCAKAKSKIPEWSTGDIVKAVIPKGKYAGTYVGRIVAKTGSFLLKPFGLKERIGVNPKYLVPVHRNDGYSYSF